VADPMPWISLVPPGQGVPRPWLFQEPALSEVEGGKQYSRPCFSIVPLC